jgi:hypothetical protein
VGVRLPARGHPWPHSQKGAEEIFGDIPRDEADKITYRNAEQLFRWRVADPALAELS